MTDQLRYGSVCSGIEAATAAWHPLGWRLAWFAEIDAFPSAVLAHHYPDVPNLGDMTALSRRVLLGEIEAPDVLVGGTPCQAFSVAGMRRGLDDPRGRLTIAYTRLFDAIDHARSLCGTPPAVCVWENVPGVLSQKDNAFGSFLGALSGESCELKPPGRRWANAGCVFGPTRTVAWRILDAQFFGLAQRRRRVFVVASARRSGIDPTAVLFESQGVRRDSPPSRETGEGSAAGALRSTDGGSDVDHARAGHLIAHTLCSAGFDASEDGSGRGIPLIPAAYGGNNTAGPIDVASACRAKGGSGHGDFESETFVVQPIAFDCKAGGNTSFAVGDVPGSLRGVGHGGGHAAVKDATGVRRLTPRECERLQGFPDDYTLIPIGRAVRPEKLNADWIKYLLRGGVMTFDQVCRAAADGPRYKAIGNSMAVPVMAWIGRRIELARTRKGNAP